MTTAIEVEKSNDMTFEQFALILETPLGGYDQHSDLVVAQGRHRIRQIYEQLKEKHSFSEASLQARVQWIKEMLGPLITQAVRDAVREVR